MKKNNFSSVNDQSLAIINCEENHIEAHDAQFGPNIYNCYIIECCTKGVLTIVINDNEFTVKEGDCYVLIPGDRITHKTTSKSPRSELTCFIRSLEMKNVLKQAGITAENPFARPSAYKEVCESIKRIINLEKSQSVKSDYLRTSEIYKIMAALINDKTKVETTSIIKKATDIIENEYMKDMSVDNIANRVGLERCYFSVLFKRHTGQTPHAYLNSVRVSKACMLMALTELSIAEIAIQVGLEPSGFARMFKREIGVTPGKYRSKS